MDAATVPILLVEDNPDDVVLIKRALGRTNLANPVQVVEDGDEAVAYLAGEGPYGDRRQHPLPVLILLDLKLPKRSGHEVLAWIGSQAGLRRIPVAVLSSSGEPSDVNRAYDLGANAYLRKPVVFEELVELVKATNLFWLILNERPDPSGADTGDG